MWLAKCPLPTPVSPVINMVQWRCAARSASCNHRGMVFESFDSFWGGVELPKPGAGGLLAMSFSLFPPLSADGSSTGIPIPFGQGDESRKNSPRSLAHTQSFECVSHGNWTSSGFAGQNELRGSLSFRAADVGSEPDPSLFSNTNVTRTFGDASTLYE